MAHDPHFVLILACSARKQAVDRCAAGELYTGAMFLAGKSIALQHGIPFFILSAKYGFLKPTTVVDNYDVKFTTPFKGDFPPPPWHGFFLGGDNYFKFAPDRFERLVPRQGLGYMLSAVTKLRDNKDAVQHLVEKHKARLSLV